MPKSTNKQETVNNKDKKPTVKAYPRSYKLEPHIMEILNATLARARGISPKKVSEARVIKALIIYSKNLSDKQLEESLKEVW